MSEVIIIYDLNYGDEVSVAADYKSAIYYLLKEGWIDDYTEVYDNNSDKYLPISEAFGKNWRTVVLNANEDWFNNQFEQYCIVRAKIYKQE